MNQFCTNCGKQLMNNASFCTNCGTKISNNQRGLYKEYKFTSMHGGRCMIILDNDKLTIRRKGIRSFANHGLKGDKTIMLKQISSIQLKEAGVTVGYLLSPASDRAFKMTDKCTGPAGSSCDRTTIITILNGNLGV